MQVIVSVASKFWAIWCYEIFDHPVWGWLISFGLLTLIILGAIASWNDPDLLWRCRWTANEGGYCP